MPSKNNPLPAGFVIRAPDWKREKGAIADFVAKIFARPYHEWATITDSYLTDAAYDADASRIGLVDGEIATHWGVWRHQMRVGLGRWTVAGVGCVACRPDFRKRGLLSATARSSMAVFGQAGYDATMLAGIADFYHRFGYVSSFPTAAFMVRPERMPPPAERGPVRLPESRRPDIDRLYNAAHARVSGTVVRPFLPGRFPGARDPEVRARGREGFYGWAKGGLAGPGRARPGGGAGGGPLAGYVAVAWDAWEARLTVLEEAGPAGEALAAASWLAREWGAREVHFDTLPPAGPLATLLRAGVCRETTERSSAGGPMIACVSLAGMLRGLLPELAERRRQSPWAVAWSGALRLEGDRQAAALVLRKGQIEVQEKPSATPHRIAGGVHLAQLLIGECAPAELAARGTVRFSGDAAPLAAALFPDTHPAWARLDYY